MTSLKIFLNLSITVSEWEYIIYWHFCHISIWVPTTLIIFYQVFEIDLSSWLVLAGKTYVSKWKKKSDKQTRD